MEHLAVLTEMGKVVNNYLITFKEDFESDKRRILNLGAEHVYLWGVRKSGTNLLCLSHAHVIADILTLIYDMFKTNANIEDIRKILERSLFVSININEQIYLLENGTLKSVSETNLEKIKDSYTVYIYKLYKKCFNKDSGYPKRHEPLFDALKCANEVKRYNTKEEYPLSY